MKKKEKTLSEGKVRMAQHIAVRIINVQQKWAGTMAALASKFSIKNQKRILAIVTATAAIFWTSLIINSFEPESAGKTNSVPVFMELRKRLMADSSRSTDKNYRQKVPELVDSTQLIKKGQ